MVPLHNIETFRGDLEKEKYGEREKDSWKDNREGMSMAQKARK